MALQPPKFWSSTPTDKEKSIAMLMRPIGNLYAAVMKRKLEKAIPYRATGPVVCVGNVSTGGVGKTPFAIMLAKLLQDQKLNPHFLTRGYGGSIKGPEKINLNKHVAAQSGDEPLLLAKTATTWVARKRPDGAIAAFNEGADIIIMDDGFQNPSLYKDYSFLLIDVQDPFGNGQVIPAGPLREKPQDARERADAVVFVLQDKDDLLPPNLATFAGTRPQYTAWLETEDATLKTDKPVIVFAGIGKPEKFFDTAEKQGYDIVERLPFPDHYAFTEEDVNRLTALAKEKDAVLLTTQKDFARLPENLRTHIETLSVRMKISDPLAITKSLLPLTGQELVLTEETIDE